MSGVCKYKPSALLAGAALLFLIGCGGGGGGGDSAGSSDPPVVASDPPDPPSTGGIHVDPPGDTGGNLLGGDPNGDPPGPGEPGIDGATAVVPEPATCLLFLCAAGSAALAQLRARKRA